MDFTDVGGLVVASLALVFSILSWLASFKSANAADRSAGASEISARAATRSADAAQSAEVDRLTDRHEAKGPRFTQEGARLSTDRRQVEVKLRMKSDTPPLRLTLDAVGISSVVGVRAKGSKVAAERETSLTFPPIEDGDVVEFVLQLSAPPAGSRHETVLPVRISAEAGGDDQTFWDRRVPVTIWHPTATVHRAKYVN